MTTNNTQFNLFSKNTLSNSQTQNRYDSSFISNNSTDNLFDETDYNKKCGPFRLYYKEEAHPHISERCSVAPVRKTNCENYQKCLDIAACLDWDSFNCKNCCGEVKQNFNWQMHQKIRKDAVCKALFTPEPIKIKTFKKS